MRAYGVTLEMLEHAATEVQVELFQVQRLSRRGTSWQFTLRPRRTAVVKDYCMRCTSEKKGKHYDAGCKGKRVTLYPWQRVSCDERRRVFAVCWHGHRAFFRAVFKHNPSARFRTKVDHWSGSEDFEARHARSGMQNVGSAFRPMDAADACLCSERR